MIYFVKREFVDGPLKGLVYKELSRTKLVPGKTYYKPVAGTSPFVVVECRPATLGEMFNSKTFKEGTPCTLR